MEFDIGNILYIVITLVAVIIGLLGKKKKPQEGGSGAQEGEARPGFLENLERVLTMGQEQPQVRDLQDYEADLPVEELIPNEVEAESHGNMRGRPSIMDEYDRIMNRRQEDGRDSGMGDGDPMNEQLEVIDLEDISGTDYFEIVRDFDAGTAVVYAAIINRLDY